VPLDDENVVISPDVLKRLAPPSPQAPLDDRLTKQLGAAWSLESDIGSVVAAQPAPDYNLPYEDPEAARSYTVEDKLTPEEKAYSDRFNSVFSDEGLAHVREQIEREKTMKAALADGPLPEWLASMAGGAASLSTLIPIAGPLAKGGTAVRAAGSLARVGGTAALGAAVQESILQSTQVTRTMEESAASVIGAFLLGGTLGAAVGGMVRPEAAALGRVLGEARPRIEKEITTMIRAAGLGDFPPPRTGLYDSTGIARFLDADNSPNFKLQRVHQNGLADRDLLNVVGDQSPHLVENVSKTMREVEVLQDRIDRLTADPTLFSRAPTIKDKPTLDMLAQLDREGTPDAKARAAQIREGAQPAVTLNRLLDQMDEATSKWEKAEAALADRIKKTKDQLDEIGSRIDEPSRAKMSTEINRIYEAMKKAIDEGKDPLSLKPKDPMAWLEGFAKFPVEGKAQTVSFVSGKKIVGTKGGGKAAPEVKPPVAEAGATEEAKSLSAAATGAGAGYTPVYANINRLRASFKAAEVSAWLKKIGMASPAIELSMSRFETARDAIQRLVYTGMSTEGHFQGVAAPPDLHTEIARIGNPLMLQVESIAAKGFDAYKLNVKAGMAPPMTRLEFNQAVAEAMTKGDVGAHTVISDTAKAYRVIDDKLKDLATEYKVGVFKDGGASSLKGTAKSHLYRAWQAEKIRTNPSGFRAMVQDWIVRGGGNADDAAEAASEVMHKILGSPEGRLIPEIKIAEGRGSAKERTFTIPDDFVTSDGRYATKDFVDRNVVNVMAQYVRTMSSDIAYKKILDGDKGVADMMDALKREADNMIDDLGPGKKESAEAKKIMTDLDREQRVILETIHRVRGTDPTPMDPRYHGLRSAGKIMRDFNVIRVMGSAVLSQLPDLARPMVVHGFSKVFGSAVGDLVDGFKMVKLGIKEAQRVGTATDMVLAGRAGQIADLSEQVTRQSKTEMVTGIAAHKALTLFGVSPWTVYQKARISYLGTDDMLRQIDKIGKGQEISQKWKTQLAGLGIDKETALAIFKEQPNWEEASRGFWVANTEKWKDQAAANKFSDALLRHIDNMIISPTAADRPLWTQTEVGKAVSQFQGFGWATHQRILISGLQDRDAAALTSVAAMMGLGMVSVAMRDIVNNGKIDEKRDARGWLREGFDRAGVASRFMETDAMVKKAIGTSPVTALSGGQTERTASRGFVGQALGSTAGLVDDTAKAIRGVADGSLSGTDLHNMRRIMPLQNFVVFKGILDRAEENLVTRMGLDPRPIPR
jgi:hypothetical protein